METNKQTKMYKRDRGKEIPKWHNMAGKNPPNKQTEEQQIREKVMPAGIRRKHNKVEHSRD